MMSIERREEIIRELKIALAELQFSVADLRAALAALAAATGRAPNGLAASQPTLDQVAEMLRKEGDADPKLILTTRVRPAQEQRQ